MYVDDTKVLRQVDTKIDREELQNDLDKWVAEWQIQFNVSNC